jgi:hypothetical protein
MMSMLEDEVTVSFSTPTITRKEYIVRGPSGWPETFKRDVCDQALAKFLGVVNTAELVDLFVTQRQLADKTEPANWHTIVGYLGRTFGVSPKAVPHEAGIAFWAHVVMARQNAIAN